MEDRLIFVIGPPRSGSTLLMRMLASHSRIFSGPEPHMLTPLAHLGYYENVDKAPYDHLNAQLAMREFVDRLPEKEADYLTACRGYTDHLYRQMLATTEAELLVDKTPAYGLVLPFLEKLYPRARYIVLTRHPAAVFCSHADSFFDGDWRAAHDFNPLVERYVPAMAGFLRRGAVPLLHVRYEDMVSQPEHWLEKICDFLGLDFEPDAVNYGDHKFEQGRLNDPIGVHRDRRPNTKSIDKWARTLAGDPERRAFVERIIGGLQDEDLETWGYPRETVFEALEQAQAAPAKKKKWDRYSLERRTLLLVRKQIRRGGLLAGLVKKTRFVCDVLLR